jgi:membrane protein implicated in regulation of membrane protease activity
MPRLAIYALIVCLLATAAAVVSFVNGSWLVGVVWVLLAGLTSNMWWYYRRKAKADEQQAQMEAAVR